VGQKRLSTAISEFKGNECDIKVEWKPYIIDSGTAKDGETFEDYNQRRWGGSGWTNQLKQEGRKDGATFKDWKWWPNTLRAHQLVKFAQEKHGVDTELSNGVLFNALYEEGKNISLLEVLVQLAENQLNIPGQEVRDYLNEDNGADGVHAEIKQGRQSYRISGVPFFIIENENDQLPPHHFSGAQKSKVFLDLFNKLER